ncbi:MAG TPA: LamG-like jellyroll fold domain-containing protein [Armatimonadota bacterium]
MYNAALSARSLGGLPFQASTPLISDGEQASGYCLMGGATGRHQGSYILAFVDGHVSLMKPDKGSGWANPAFQVELNGLDYTATDTEKPLGTLDFGRGVWASGTSSTVPYAPVSGPGDRMVSNIDLGKLSRVTYFPTAGNAINQAATSGMTIAFWFRCNNTTVNNDRVMFNGANVASTATANWHIKMGDSSAKAEKIQAYFTWKRTAVSESVIIATPNGIWQHIAIVKDNQVFPAKTIVYINGSVSASYSNGNVATPWVDMGYINPNPDSPISIGTSVAAYSGVSPFTIGGVKIYTRAMTTEEVQTLVY